MSHTNLILYLLSLLKKYFMAKVKAFHSTLRSTSVYHNNDECTEGNNIEKRNLQQGTGGKKLCHHCNNLNLVKGKK